MGRILKEFNGDFMKVEYSKDAPKTKSKRNKKPRTLRPVFYIFIGILVLGVFSALMLTVLFNVEKYTVNGKSIYSRDEIISACGIEEGDNLIRVSSKKAEEQILKTLPYIKTVKIKKDFPYTVTIEVTAAEEFASVEYGDEVCIIDTDCKVLKKEKSDATLPKIKGIDITDALVGEALEFDSEDSKKAFDILRESTELRDMNVTFYDIGDHLDLKIAVDDRVFIELGSTAYIDRKLSLAAEAISTEPSDVQMVLSLKEWTIDNPKCVRTYEDVNEMLK